MTSRLTGSTGEQQPPEQEQPEEQQQPGNEEQQQPGNEEQQPEEQQPEEQQPEEQPGELEAGDTFPRAYVEKLRDESHRYRTERTAAAERVAALTAAVWKQQLELDGRLADVTDIAMPEDFDGQPEAVTAAVTALLEAKPHLAARRATGDIGQHSSADDDGAGFSIFGAMREHA